MDKYLLLEEHPGYVQDVRSSALLNTDLSALAEHKQKRKQSKQIQSMQEEINMLKDEIGKIKSQLNLS
jgi:hypothetical protein